MKCCIRGKIQFPFLLVPTDHLLKLIFDQENTKAKHFQQHIRAYNMMLSFTSMVEKLTEESMMVKVGIFGQNHHRICNLLPQNVKQPKFAQLYIYDIAQQNEEMFDCYKPIAMAFRMERDRFDSEQDSNFKLRLIRKREKNSKIYNLPIIDELVRLIVSDIDVHNEDRDSIMETQMGICKELMSCTMYICQSIHYSSHMVTYGIPHGQLSDPDGRKKNFKNVNLKMLLFCMQIFVVDGYTMIEAQMLAYICFHKKKLRVYSYKGLVDAVFEGETDECATGNRILMPSSFTSGARYLMQNYQDAMAISNWAGFPDIFITFTCNLKWPELSRYVQNLAFKPEDRPDIVAHIFRMKLKQLMKDLKYGQIYGCAKAVVYRIEFQKKGLPHYPILLFLNPNCKHLHPEDIDQIISTEIPYREYNPKLFEIVKEYMVHGPCGSSNRHSPCMIDGRCSKFYPKDFTSYTKVDEDEYPIYSKKDNGRIVIELQQHYMNDIEIHIQMRRLMKLNVYFSKAIWRIFGFEINYRKSAMERLIFHLPNQQPIVYEDGDSLESILERHEASRTMFTAWMDAKKTYLEAKRPQYLFINPRKRGYFIGRLFHVPLSSGELFYLSLLLNTIEGPESYSQVRIVDGVEYPSVRDSCYKLGLLNDEKEFIDAIKEASLWDTGHCLRAFLQEIENKELSKNGKSLKDFPLMPSQDVEVYATLSNRLIAGQLHFDKLELVNEFNRFQTTMTNEQKSVFYIIVSPC
ncbi:hypothetical protein HKD37_12G033934 [Glycine soja]